ncbi:hypothetical protein [Nitrospira sp. Nam74]
MKRLRYGSMLTMLLPLIIGCTEISDSYQTRNGVESQPRPGAIQATPNGHGNLPAAGHERAPDPIPEYGSYTAP